MDFETPKRKKGETLVKVIMLIIVPIVAYLLTRMAVMRFQHKYQELNEATAKFLGFIIGTFFHMACVISGAFKDSFAVVKNRWAEFKDNASLSFGFAVKCYLEDIKDGGIEFLVEMTCIVACFIFAMDGLFTVIALI